MDKKSPRVVSGEETEYPWEREAIDFVVDALPDTDPHRVWALQELYDPSSGRLFEIDLLVLSRTGLYLVEIKSNPGVLTGDMRDWTFREPGGRPKNRDCPYPTTNKKAKKLRSLLDRHWKGRPGRAPWVQALVFLSAEGLQVRLRDGTPPWLTTREDVRQVLVNGIGHGRSGAVINKPTMRALSDVFHELGLRPRRSARIVGGYTLKELLDEGPAYQEHRAHNEAISDSARVRSYLVPRQTTPERRQMLQRAAEREAKVLARLGRHPRILGYRSFVPDAPLGPALLFECFDGGRTLDDFLRDEPDLPFDDRLDILQQVTEAVEHVHRNEYLHRNLSPGSVLVRRTDAGLEVRLHRFATAMGGHTSLGTVHVDDLARERDRLYQAPEVLSDPAKATTASDVFSLGALAFFLLTGLPPAATLRERERVLREGDGLHLSAVRDDLSGLDDAIAFATAPFAVNRIDSAFQWFEAYFLEQLTRPAEPETTETDVYDARPGDTLLGGYTVIGKLGSGATARVFHVRKDDRSHALKVPHDDGCEERLREEAEVLRGLRHTNIVRYDEVLHLGDRACLLMEFAGDKSLADELREQGTLDLDTARTWGEDLLQALQYLEEHGITHRDIKPGNLGFSSLKKRKAHLTLYDFSLAASDPRGVASGTPEWRDPWLHLRGRWDAAADRFAAAAVLHRMLAGVRPQLVDSGPARGTVKVEAERLDAALRDRLAGFFARSFEREIADRYPTAEAMRSEWVALFVAPRHAPQPESPAADAALDAADSDTRIDALPLSSRARNALDRAGVLTVAELLGLPRNHLSAIRGIGHKVAREIVDMAEALRTRLTVDAVPGALPDFPGPVLSLDAEELELDVRTFDALTEAALTNTADIAACPRSRLDRLVGEEAAARLVGTLERLASEMPAPGTVGDWLGAMLIRLKSERTKADDRGRVLVGLDRLPKGSDEAGRGGRSVNQVATAFDIEPALVHSSLQFLRKRWAEGPVAGRLRDAVEELLAGEGPAASFERLGTELARRRSPGTDPSEADVADAVCAVRLAAEVRPTALQWRLIGGRPWTATDPSALDALAHLADAADDLAAREPLPSSEAVRSLLAEHAAGTPWADQPIDRLVSVAAEASRRAAGSARLELYPRRMPAARAIRLSQPVLVPPTSGDGLSVDAVQRSVAARYPDAEPVPGRPVLDRLLAPLALTWSDAAGDEGGYLRPGVAHGTTTGTVQLPGRTPRARTHQPLRQSPTAQEAREFLDSLRRGLDAGRFRVVQVRADLSEQVVEPLAAETGTDVVSLDHALWKHVEAVAAAKKVRMNVLLAADREGPEGPQWGRLCTLMQLAAGALVDDLLAHRDDPRLLVRPGALARYGLAETITALSLRAQSEEGAGIVLLLPSHDDGRAPSINGTLPVPTETAGQRLRLPESWMRGEHRAPAL